MPFAGRAGLTLGIVIAGAAQGTVALAAHLAGGSDWTRGLLGRDGQAAEALMREDLWRFGPPHGGETGGIIRMDGDGGEEEG